MQINLSLLEKHKNKMPRGRFDGRLLSPITAIRYLLAIWETEAEGGGTVTVTVVGNSPEAGRKGSAFFDVVDGEDG